MAVFDDPHGKVGGARPQHQGMPPGAVPHCGSGYPRVMYPKSLSVAVKCSAYGTLANSGRSAQSRAHSAGPLSSTRYRYTARGPGGDHRGVGDGGVAVRRASSHQSGSSKETAHAGNPCSTPMMSP
jgi:hypothetical protein